MTATPLVPHLEARVRPHADKGNRRMRLLWETPTIKTEFICRNCDAEHDGVDWHPNHTGDIYCRYYEDQ
jgi:hypothetical protein